MSKIVEVPGLGNVEFPDEMSDEAIGQAIGQAIATSTAQKDPEAERSAAMEQGLKAHPWYTQPFASAVRAGGEVAKAMREPRKYIIEGIDPDTGKPNVVQSALRGVLQGGTLGFSDELAGAIAPGEYAQNRDVFRAKNVGAREAHPLAYGAGTLGGALALPVPGSAVAGGARTALASAGRGAAQGAAFGGLFGAGTAQGGAAETVGEALKGAAVGGALGGGLAGGGAKIGSVLKKAMGRYATKGLGATRVDVARMDTPARGGVPGTSQRIGEEALRRGVPLTDPEAAVLASKALKREAGQAMGAVKTAKGAENAVDFAGFAKRVEEGVVKKLAAPETPQFHGAAKGVRDYVDSLAEGLLRRRAASQGRVLLRMEDVGNKKAMAEAMQAYRSAGGSAAQPKWAVMQGESAEALGKISLEEAHTIRQGLDRATKAYGIPTPESAIMRQALIATRNQLAQAMSEGAEAIGRGPAWEEASRAFKDAALINRTAARGAERVRGNDPIGLTTVVAGAGGLSHGPLGAILGGAANKAVQRYGNAAMAHAARAGSTAIPATTEPASIYGPRLIAALSGGDESTELERVAAEIEALRRRTEGR